MLLRVVPKREDGRLALALALAPTFAGGASLSKSSSPAAAKAFAVLGPSQSVMDRGGGIWADAAGPARGVGDVVVTRFSITEVLRLRVRTPMGWKRGRSMSRLGLCSCRRLGAVPIDEGARDEGDVESSSQAAGLRREFGGRDALAEARAGVISLDAGDGRDSPSIGLPRRRSEVLADISEPAARDSRARAAAAALTRSGLEDIARLDDAWVRVTGEGGPDRVLAPSTGRSDTERVIRGREEVEGRRGAAESVRGRARRVDALKCASTEGCGEVVADEGVFGGGVGGRESPSRALNSAGSVLLPLIRLGLSSAARSGSSAFRLKLVSGLSGVRP